MVDAVTGPILTAKLQRMDALTREKVSGAEQYFELAERKLRDRAINDAIAAYHSAEAAGYDADACAGSRWICHMLLGHYDAAWRESDAIDRRGRPDPNKFWSGQALDDRRVIVRCLHGLGDTIQYARYLPLVRQRVSFLALQPQPQLKQLFAQSDLADQVLTWNEAEPNWDLQLEIVELPRIFRTTVASIPRSIPYLNPPASRFPVSPRKLHVGLVWASGGFNPARCIRLAELSRALKVPNCEFFSLQAGPDRKQLEACDIPIIDLHDPDACVLDTASKLKSLDLLISVDTMVAHLAGALGIPVWTLLPFEADWRWMLDREDSPWYPTMRLFRQNHPGDWTAPIDKVRSELISASVQAA